MHILTKSKYIRGLQCVKALYLEVYQPKLAYYPPETLALFKKGRAFEALFRSTFPNGEDLRKLLHWKMDQYPIVTQQKLSQEGEVVLFEAGFCYDGVLVLADVVHKHDGVIDIYEIKNGTSAKEVFRNDVAIQHYVVSHCIDNLSHFYLLYNDGEDGFAKEECFPTPQHDEIAANIAHFKEILQGFEPQIAIDEHCNIPYPCPFHRYCDLLNC